MTTTQRANLSNTLRRWARQVTGRILHRPEMSLPAVTIGTEYGSHTVPASGLGPASVVYSFGIGEDVSFDLGMIERFGCTIHAFDPTPKSVAWVAANIEDPRFRFSAVGIGPTDETVAFDPPAKEGNASFSRSASGSESAGLSFPVRRLSSLMAERGHSHIDVLKLDIEGFEYDVLRDVMGSPVRPQTIAVEFHHRMYSFGDRDTENAVELLRTAGYRLFHVSDTGREYSFAYRP